MTISSILESKGGETIVATPDMSVSDAVRLFAERRIGAVPVLDGDTVVGIMSERDLVHIVAAFGAAALDKNVGEVMTSPPITVEKDHSILGALGLMTRRRIRHLPVLDGGELIGFVSIGDLVKYRMDRIEQDAAAMRDYIQQV
ncbi:CBS domain-containing protein [Parasphingopyxis marina]|uniref:CBS domain-containing protein n=1 Tax=Parasphingopyxis marina TaxID=2761622 RepID=A0A842HUL0_9SPHN|nr:CBS domain-containing protein [Parasphingopyxis marina]MBC2776071.1 CBS domain-containing protein [Parasphingopyxis marina]